MRADEEYMVSLWQHEITRVVKDRISRSVDIKWFEKTLKAVTKEVEFMSYCALFRVCFLVTQTVAQTGLMSFHLYASSPQKRL